ncbi:radical SAM protein [Candidatus Woesearchaeota archaeon]|nr:radical SAM protein [Candidatus Woesearchaeota archaeon]
MNKIKLYAGLIFGKENNLENDEKDISLIENKNDLKELSIPYEFFSIPYKDEKSILYFPEIGSCFLISKSIYELVLKIKNKENIELDKKEIAILNYFLLNGIIDINVDVENNKKRQCCQNNEKEECIEYLPVRLHLCPTSACNLRCIYCYASGGDNSKYMDFKLAKASIDFVIENIIKKKEKKLELSFHGGGEVMMAFNLVKQAINYTKDICKKHDILLSTSLATNLVLKKDHIDYIINNFNFATISVDGTKDIHNKQRPTANGEGSFEIISNNIKTLEENNFPYGIRVTITKDSVEEMEKIAKFFINDFKKAKSYHFEPLFKVNRAEKNDLDSVDMFRFGENFLKAKKVIEKDNKRIFMCSGSLEETETRFCGALKSGFWVTPEGYVTTCAEVLTLEDSRADPFIIGKYDDEKNQFVFNYERIKKLRSRDVRDIENCKNCFAKYHCKGYCPTKVAKITGDIMDTKNIPWCGYTKKILKTKLLELLEKKEFQLTEEDYMLFGEPDKLTEDDIVEQKLVES